MRVKLVLNSCPWIDCSADSSMTLTMTDTTPLPDRYGLVGADLVISDDIRTSDESLSVTQSFDVRNNAGSIIDT